MKLFMPIIEDQISKTVEKLNKQEKKNGTAPTFIFMHTEYVNKYFDNTKNHMEHNTPCG